MIKKVNVYPAGPIFTVRPAIMNTLIEAELPVGDIQNCILARAAVDEVLTDGTTIRLDLSNYNKVNESVKEVVEEVQEEVQIEPEVVEVEVTEEEPTIEEVQEEEPTQEEPVEETTEVVEEKVEVDSFEELPSKNNYKEKKKNYRIK